MRDPNRQRRAAIYCRISKIPQAELDQLAEDNPGRSRAELVTVGSSLGVVRQEKACRQIAAQHGWKVAGVFTDDDRSAYSGKHRPGYLEMLEAIKAGEVDAIVAWSPMRLTRHPRELEDLADLLDAHRIEVATHTAGDYDLSTAGGRLVARVVGSVARHESEEKSERLVLKMAEIAESGGWHGGTRPYGYRADGVTPDPDEAAVVVEAVSRIAAGETLARVADDLNAREVPTAGGKAWTLANIRRMCMNRRYIGRRTHRGEDVGEAVWPALVDEAVWRRAQHVLTVEHAQPRRRAARKYLLSGGLVVCGKCGGRLAGKPKRGQALYACKPKRLGGCAGVSIWADELDQLVTEEVFRMVESAGFGKALRTRAGADRMAVATIRAIEAERDELARALGSGAISMREFTIARGLQDERLAQATAQAATDQTSAAVGRYAGRKNSLRQVWSSLTLDKRQAIIRRVVEHVVVAARSGPVGEFDPGRVSIVWRA